MFNSYYEIISQTKSPNTGQSSCDNDSLRPSTSTISPEVAEDNDLEVISTYTARR